MSGGSGKGKGGAALLMLVAAVIMSIGYLLALLLRFAISRKREYLADAGAVDLTKNPKALMTALQKISGNAAMPNVPSEVRQMFIENPPHMGLTSLFATHPPIEDRISILAGFAGETLLPKGDSIIPKS
jgi:heat shock protein HtpX